MPILRKTKTRLLRVVGNKQHATDEDHVVENAKTLSPTTVPLPRSNGGTTAANAFDELEDFTRSPESSDIEVEEIRPAPRASDIQKLKFASTNLSTKTENGNKGPASKRKADDSDDEGPIFSTVVHSSQAKSQIRSSGSSGHAFKKTQDKRITYGTQGSQARSSQVERARKTKKEFKTTKALTVEQDAAPKQATFRIAGDASIFRFGVGSTEADTMDVSRSPSSSRGSTPPSSPDVLTHADLGQARMVDGSLKVKCEACSQDVDLLLKQQYEDEYAQDRAFNIRRQNAFCKYHTQHDARQQWRKEGYPEIDWQGLDVRLQRQHARLRSIIERRTESSFRQLLEQHLATRSERKNGLEEELEASTAAISAGYYGPRGQKVIIDHIVTHLAEALREASRTDPLLLAAGRSAGLSGYVQRVLVPEVALALIKQDLDVDEAEARLILSKSQRLGEILHEEERDIVVNLDDDEREIG